MSIRLRSIPFPISPNPPSSRYYIGFNSSNSNHLTIQDSTGSLIDLQSGLEYTDEKAQDAVGSILTDTASIDMSYNDVLNTISAAVIPGGVDHDALQNFVANEHVDHSAVSITAGTGLSGGGDITASRVLSVNEGAVNHDNLLNFVANEHVDHSAVSVATAATSGLSGGGDLTATRNLALNITGLTAGSERLNGLDEVPVYDVSLGAHRKYTRLQMRLSDTDQVIVTEGDFIQSTLSDLTSVVSGTGASAQAGTYGIDLTQNCLGVLQIDTGTTATGRVVVGSTAFNHLILGVAQMRSCWRLAPEALSTGGVEQYTLYCGFIDNSAAGDHTDGLYFRYTDVVNSGRWEAVVAAGGSRIAIDTGVAAGIDYKVFEVEVNQAGTEANFFIDGVLVATHTTGLPTLITQSFGYGCKMEKSVGTTQRNTSIDWYCFELLRTTAR